MKRIIISVVFFIIMLLVFSISLKPKLDELARKEIKQFVSLVINHVTLTNAIDTNQLLDIKYKNDEISSIQFDMFYINKIASNYIQAIESTLISIENGTYKQTQPSIYHQRLNEVSHNKGIVASIPLGACFSSVFFHQYGPKLSVTYKTKTLTSSHLKKTIKQYGINHIAVSIDLDITIDMQIVLPISLSSYKQTFSVPLIFEIIEGDIPSWYKVY